MSHNVDGKILSWESCRNCGGGISKILSKRRLARVGFNLKESDGGTLMERVEDKEKYIAALFALPLKVTFSNTNVRSADCLSFLPREGLLPLDQSLKWVESLCNSFPPSSPFSDDLSMQSCIRPARLDQSIKSCARRREGQFKS